jgi:hypothetical protein
MKIMMLPLFENPVGDPFAERLELLFTHPLASFHGTYTKSGYSLT